MKLLLTSAGIANPSIRAALEELLAKPISQSRALFVAAGMYPFPGGGTRVLEVLRGQSGSPLIDLGWESLGLLEITALTSIRREHWVDDVAASDALLVWGGNVMYLKYWMERSGLADLLPTLEHVVYVGVSAGSIVMTPFNCDAESNVAFAPDDGEVAKDARHGLGLVDFTMWVHVGNPNPIFEDHTLANVQRWASGVTVPTYALDDASAIKVDGHEVEVVSEGQWTLFSPASGGHLEHP